MRSRQQRMPEVRHPLVIQRPARLLGIHREADLPEFRVTHDRSPEPPNDSSTADLLPLTPWEARPNPLVNPARRSRESSSIHDMPSLRCDGNCGVGLHDVAAMPTYVFPFR